MMFQGVNYLLWLRPLSKNTLGLYLFTAPLLGLAQLRVILGQKVNNLIKVLLHQVLFICCFGSLEIVFMDLH